MNLNAGWEAIVALWEGLNSFCMGRLLCAACLVAPLFKGRGLAKGVAFLAPSLLVNLRKALGSDKETQRLRVYGQRIVQAVLLYGVVSYARFPGSFGAGALLVARSGLAVAVFMGLSAALRPILRAASFLKKTVTVATLEWIIKICRVFLGSICAITILEWWGVHVAAFLTGLGFFGAAIVLGAQDLFKNLIAGFLILAEKRLNHGDWVQVEGVAEGYVESIGFRSTLLKRTDGAQVYVPNARLSEGTVINFAGITYRRVYWRIGLDPKISFPALKKVRIRCDQAISALPNAPQRPDASIFVHIDALSETSVDLIVSCFLPFASIQDFLQGKESFARMLVHIVEEAGGRVVLPKFALSAPSAGGQGPEIFVPPPEETKKRRTPS
ncbi:MAG: mechanosensitive ion channel family protein [Holosporales bacterium]|jgi:MscS family membrane protein|nr:mechanosensitive ion channel family protein [Holosporales bacterium]